MKKIKNIILLLLLLCMSSFSYSIGTTLTHQDSMLLDLKDTVKVPFLYVKTANKAFVEVRTWRKVAGLNQAEIHSKDVEIAYYKYANKKCEQAYDTLTLTTIPLLERKSKDYEKLYYNFKDAYRAERTQKIALSISLPVAVVLGFVIGFFINN